MGNVVSAERITKRYAAKTVLDAVTLGIDAGDRVGVIGANGSGKSTLLRLLAGVEAPDEGRIVRAEAVRVQYLPQDPPLDPSASPVAAVLAGDGEAVRTARAFERATAALRAAPEDQRAREQLARATAAMDANDAWALEQRARAVLDRLGVRAVGAPIAGRSGGQRKRIALARALVTSEGAETGAAAPLLVLDEPTNHLDVDVVEWLEDRLRALNGTLVMVTHDRYVLDRVATRMVELAHARVHGGHGSYGAYLEVRARREQQALAAERRRDNLARVELDWLRRGPRARTTKAKYRVERARELTTAERPELRHDIVIDLPSRRVGGKIVNLHNVGKRFAGRQVLRGVDYKLAPRDRVGIIGPNASGKTTLLNLIAGRLEPDEGKVVAGATVVTGYVGQELPPPAPRRRVLEHVREVVDETNRVDGITLSAAQLLEAFLFPPESQRAFVSELSGGERRRLELLLVLAGAPNLLLLDEPTNDLDLDTLGVLETYLDTWPGALVVASHDRYFLDRVCDQLFSIEPDGSIRHHPGGWSAYRERRRAQQAVAAPARARPADHPGPLLTGSRPRKLSFREQRELRALEAALPTLEERRTALTDAVQAAGPDYVRAARLSEELSTLLAELDAAESRWLELTAITEEA